MTEVMEQVKSRMGYLMLEEVSMPIGMPEKIVEKLLSLPEIFIKDPDQSLPEHNYSLLSVDKVKAYIKTQNEMLKENWVKALPKELNV